MPLPVRMERTSPRGISRSAPRRRRSLRRRGRSSRRLAAIPAARRASDRASRTLGSWGSPQRCFTVAYKRYLPCSRLSMDDQTPPRDDDPSEMTDFEKNATSEHLEQPEQEPKSPDPNRLRGRDPGSSENYS